MIKFFRKIRQTLLSDGKTGKYFKYAIGEIILVVIGILIALQINNWNEERKLQNEINTYLNQKLENLKAEKSKYVLDEGIENVDIVSFTKILYFVVIERYFTTTIERNETSITKYYSGPKVASINKLEQLYV